MNKTNNIKIVVDRLQAAWPELNRKFSARHVLADNLFSAANRFDEVAGEVWENTSGIELPAIDYRPTCTAPSFNEIKRCFGELAKHMDTLGKPPACYARFNRQWLLDLCKHSANLLGAVDWLVTESAKDDTDGDTPAPATMPDFSHRLSPVGLETGTLGLLDTVNMAADKLLAIATMLSDHFALDDDENRPSDETVFFALQSIKHEAQDIKAVVDGFHRERQNQHA